MPRAISPGPAGLKFWRAPGLSADNTADIDNLPAAIGDQFNPWGPRRPVQDWVWGNLCLYPPSEATTFSAAAGSYALTGSDAALTTSAVDTTNLPAGAVNWFNPWGRKQPVQDWFRGSISAVPVVFPAAGGSYALTGNATAVAFGHVAGSGSYTLTGSVATWALGHAAGSGNYSITGSAAALALGQVVGAGSYTLTGSSAGVAITIAAAAGSYTSTGSAVTFAFGQGAAAGSYTLTGADATFVIPGVVNYLPAGMSGGYVPWGRRFPINLRTSTGRPLEAAPTDITASAGSYTLTGSAAALTITETGNLPAGAVNWFNPWGRRFPINLRTSTGRPLEAAPASFTLTAAAGSYTISGSSAALALGLTANSGSYTVSGTAAVLARGFAAGAGAYAILGTDAQLVQAGTITLSAGAGSYIITGSDVSFITPPIEVTPPPAGGVGVRVGRYKQFKLKKKRKHDQCEELLEYLRSLPPAEAEAAVAELPPRYLSLLDGLPLPHALVLPPARTDDDDDDACALLLELLLR